MKKPIVRVSLAFARRVAIFVLAFARNVVKLMTNNLNYPTPSPTLASVTAAADDLEEAIQNAFDGGKIAIATRNAALVTLVGILRDLALYVQGHCSNSLSILLSSGFDAVRTPQPSGQLLPPENVTLYRTTISGELGLRMKRVTNALNYTIQMAESPEGPWTDKAISSTTRVSFTGLTPGKVYWARAAANGTKGSSGWSAPTSAMAA